MEVKLFWVKAPERGFVRDSGAKAIAFEQHINEWLAQNPDIEIRHIKQSASGGSWGPSLWLVSVWYDRNRA